MMTTQRFNDNYLKVFDADIVEGARKPDKIQIMLEENNLGRIYRHFF